ncbi:hypothetical protein [Bifidobacterium apri]|uniref:hypothetical protein n=1 Tax=Bifidobacterium apri TaxID=1769423 RepID=UPI0039919064
MVVPFALAVITPEFDTVATFVSFEDHTGWTVLGVAEASKSTVVPLNMVIVASVTTVLSKEPDAVATVLSSRVTISDVASADSTVTVTLPHTVAPDTAHALITV